MADSEQPKQWTVEDETKLIYDRISEIIGKIRAMQDKINEDSQGSMQLDNTNNAGIQFNNKLVELSHVFKRAGLEFYRGSTLKNPILHKLQTSLSEGMGNIENYAKTFDLDGKKLDKKVSTEYAETVIGEANQYMDEYKKSSKNIGSFSIEKDIVNAIVEYYEANRETWELITDNGSIGRFEQELQALGVGHLIPELQTALQQRGYNNEIADNNEQHIGNDSKIEKSDISLDEVQEEISYDDDTIREPVVAGKDPLDINRVHSIALQKVQAQIKSTGQKVPGVSAALESRLLDYMDEGATAFTNGDMQTYQNVVLKIQGFNIENEISESIGVYEAYWKDVNDFHGVKPTYQEELSALEYENKIPEIDQALSDNKYGQVVEAKKSKMATYQQDMLKLVEKAVGYDLTTQDIGKATVNSPTVLKQQAMGIEQTEMARDTQLENEGVEYDGE